MFPSKIRKFRDFETRAPSCVREINISLSRRVTMEFVLIARAERSSSLFASEHGGTSYVAERVIIYLLDGWRARRPVRGCENELRPVRIEIKNVTPQRG